MNRPDIDKFLWGVSSSAFQFEGQISNDMTEWEKLGFFKRDGCDPRIGNGSDHWNQWESDFDLLKTLGVNSYRFSIEWSRVEPEPGIFDQSAIDTYSRMIDKLCELDIVPMLTIHHFTHPKWFHTTTPWHEPESVGSYIRLVKRITPLFDRIPLVITFNEPLVWQLAAYADAKFPPGKTNLNSMMRGLHNMLIAHREAYDYIKNAYPQTQIGIAKNFVVFKRAPEGTELDRQLKRIVHYFYNWMIIRAFRKNSLRFWFPLMLVYDEPIELNDKIDFWGVNYYYRLHVRFIFNLVRPFSLTNIARSSGDGLSDIGWEIYPTGLRKVCRWVRATRKPMYITENGVAADDSTRIAFIRKHLAVLEDMLDEGYDIRGYFHWTFLDNYEWLHGTSAKFGLFNVDYVNDYARKLKPSGEFYREYITGALNR